MATSFLVPPSRPSTAHRTLAQLLEPAGITLGGTEPWDIVVHDPRMPARVLARGSLGAGESYMDGWWDCERLDDMLTRLLRSSLDRRLRSPRVLWTALLAKLRNPQSRRRAYIVGRAHYDIGDDLFELMLDRRMMYSCAWWQHADSLDDAQQDKLDLVFRKLGLASGMRVLDIGCGWGGAAQLAAERYGVTVTGITVSKHQAAAAAERCKGLPVEILLEDYRQLQGRFDRIWSIGMFEHVGVRNYRSYLHKVRDLLAPDGLFLLHTIGSNHSASVTDPWIEKYIFPNSMLPSSVQITQAAESLWVLEDWHSFGPHYDRTLLEWHRRFEAGWPRIAERYGERFRRMWRYWLMVSAASFRARRNQLWQIVLSPQGVPGGYQTVR